MNTMSCWCNNSTERSKPVEQKRNRVRKCRRYEDVPQTKSQAVTATAKMSEKRQGKIKAKKKRKRGIEAGGQEL